MGNRRQETGRVVMSEYSKALIQMGRCRNKEGRVALTNCLNEANEILAEAGMISNR